MEDVMKIQKQLRLDCEEGEVSSIKATLKKYPKLLESRDNKGTTLFGIAFRKSQYEVAEYLLSIGADINASNNVLLLWK